MTTFIVQVLLNVSITILILKGQKHFNKWRKDRKLNWRQHFKKIREKGTLPEKKVNVQPMIISSKLDIGETDNRRYSIKHTRERLGERYGIFGMTETEYDGLVHAITNHASEPVLRVSQTKVIHKVHLRGQQIFVVYSKSTAKILTALGDQEVQNAQRRKDKNETKSYAKA